MSELRMRRVETEIQKIISELIEREIKDPRVKDAFVTVTRVQVSSDFSYAKVLISVLKEEKAEDALEGLKSASGFIRREVGRRIKLRLTPEIHFVLDQSLNYAIDMSMLIDKVIREDESKQS